MNRNISMDSSQVPMLNTLSTTEVSHSNSFKKDRFKIQTAFSVCIQKLLEGSGQQLYEKEKKLINVFMVFKSQTNSKDEFQKLIKNSYLQLNENEKKLIALINYSYRTKIFPDQTELPSPQIFFPSLPPQPSTFLPLIKPILIEKLSIENNPIERVHKKILRIACLIACIAVAVFGVASLIGLSLFSAGIAFPLAGVVALIVTKVGIIPSWIIAGTIATVGIASTTLRLVRR